MHILTKVFVLFAAILSVLMAALAISYTVNTDRIVADYRNAQAAADAADVAAAATKAQYSQLVASEQEAARASLEELANREADLRRLESSNAELRIALRQAEAARESITSQIAELGTTTQTQAQIIDEYKNVLNRLRQAELDYRDEKIELEKQLGDLESQVIVYEQVKRALEEQLEEVRTALAVANGGGREVAARGGGQAPAEISGPPIRGAVDQILTDPATGELLVKINLGTNDRVRQNSKLYVHRQGQQYLGELVVFQVDLNHAIGRMAYQVEGQSIRTGDQVLSKLGS